MCTDRRRYIIRWSWKLESHTQLCCLWYVCVQRGIANGVNCQKSRRPNEWANLIHSLNTNTFRIVLILLWSSFHCYASMLRWPTTVFGSQGARSICLDEHTIVGRFSSHFWPFRFAFAFELRVGRCCVDQNGIWYIVCERRRQGRLLFWRTQNRANANCLLCYAYMRNCTFTTTTP